MKGKKEPENPPEEADAESTIPSPVSSVISNECLEWSGVSKLRWKKSLDKGCLPHGLNRKARLYSHTRAFTIQEVPVEISEAYSHDGSGLFKTKSGKINERNSSSSPQPDDCHIIADLAARDFKSPVIVEDSTPPRVGQEAAVAVFTLDEFFEFLSRCRWNCQTRKVRVIGGKLLPVLIHGLICLEKTSKIKTLMEHVFLNNEFWQTDQEGLGSTNTREDDFKPKLSRNWRAEKLMVKLVYYSCLEHMPGADDDNSVDDTIERKSLQYDQKSAIAHRLYRLDRLVLDNLGIIDPQLKIKKLENEMDICKRRMELEKSKEQAAKAKPNDNKNTKPNKEDDPKEKDVKAKGMKTLDESEIENIEEDPFLFHDNHSRLINTHIEVNVSPKQSTSAPVSTKSSAVISNKTSMGNIKSNVSVKMDSVDEVKDVSQQRSSEGMVTPLEEKKSTSDAKESNIPSTISSPEHHDDEEVKGERLCLPDETLYVAALYLPVQRNLLPVKTKLKQVNHKRLAERLKTARNAFDALQTNLPFDINTRFKSLAIAKENVRRNDAASKYAKVPQKPRKFCIKDKWEKYYDEQRQMEMQVMTYSDMQSNVLKRLQKEIQRKAEYPDLYDQVQNPKSVKGKAPGKGNVNKNARHSVGLLKSTGQIATDANNSSPNRLSHARGERHSQENTENGLSSDFNKPVTKSETSSETFFTRQSSKLLVPTLMGIHKQRNIIKTEELNLKTTSYKNRDGTDNGHGQVNDQNGKPSSQNGKTFSLAQIERDEKCLSHANKKLPSLVNRKTKNSPPTMKNAHLKKDAFLLSCKTNNSVSFAAAVDRNNQRSAPPRRTRALHRASTSTSSLPRLSYRLKMKRGHGSPRELSYQSVCSCPECSYDEEILAQLRPVVRWGSFTYPFKLGHIQPRQDIPLTTHSPLGENLPQESVLSLTTVSSQENLVGMEQFEENVLERTQERLMVLMKEIVVCKEIISSSIRNTYTTITFSGAEHLIP